MQNNKNVLITLTILILIFLTIVPGSQISGLRSGQTTDSYPPPELSTRGTYTYHNYSRLVTDMEMLNKDYPSIFELYNAQSKFGLTNCRDGYKVWIIRITNETLDFNKPEVLFIGGHHGNEPVSVEAAYYFAEWLVTNYESDNHIRYLIDNREIYIMPVINPWGWENNIREDGYGEDVNRDYPYGPANTPLTTIGARSVHKLMNRHLFINAISWHSGFEAIYYAWGTPVHDTPTDEAPDNVGFRRQAKLMSDYAGDYYGTYAYGPANQFVYGVLGAWSDYAYAATWDTEYIQSDYATNGSRTIAIGVEISQAYAPSESTLGNSDGVYDLGGGNDGYIPKNIRMALALTDTAQPYLNWIDRDNIPAMAYPGEEITFEWEVMGCTRVDRTGIRVSTNSSVASFSALDNDNQSRSGLSSWYGAVYSQTVKMPDVPGEYYFAAAAVVDQNTLNQTVPDPELTPQSFFVNMRTNATWQVSNNGNSLQGQLNWYSDAIKITVEEPGRINITGYPSRTETHKTIQINWSIELNPKFRINQTRIYWSNESDFSHKYPYGTTYPPINIKNVTMGVIYNFSVTFVGRNEPDNYYSIAYMKIENIENRSIQKEYWSQLVTVEIHLPLGGYNIYVTTPSVGYSDIFKKDKIDITFILLESPYIKGIRTSNSGIKVNKYVIFNSDNKELKSGNLSWTGVDWQALNINISNLPNGKYYVTCYFEHEYGNGSNLHSVNDSSEFIIERKDDAQELQSDDEDTDRSVDTLFLMLLAILLVIILILIFINLSRKKPKKD